MPDWLIVLLIGTLVGIIPGLFGVGGGFLTVPLLHVFAGVPLHLCVGVSSSQALGPVTTGMLHRHALGKLEWRIGLIMIGGTVVGLLLGIEFLEWATKSAGVWHVFGRDLPGTRIIIPCTNLALLLSLSALVAWEYRHNRTGSGEPERGWLDDWHLPPYVSLPELQGRRASITLLQTIALGIGFLNGGLGMGGAIVMMPALVYLVGVDTHRAITATLVVSWLNSIVGTLRHAWLGNVDLELVCWLLVGGGVGAKFGSWLHDQLSGRHLRGYFSLLILASAGLVAWEIATILW
ncbi:MAG: sulfite exporter TauE/SafE family protein [Planctomycetaceae bacterium]|nr:sulfite exporter TauE/SafE family protein [Planctomycetaceae bacterium]